VPIAVILRTLLDELWIFPEDPVATSPPEADDEVPPTVALHPGVVHASPVRSAAPDGNE
jgi:hypothetical protein